VGKVLLILIAACLLATFMIINRSSFIPTTSPSQTNENVSTKAEKDQGKPEQSSRSKAAKKGTTNRSQRSGVTNSTKDSDGTAVVQEKGKEKEKESNREQDFANAIVKGDDTPVYSVNSRQGTVVRMLKKGDKVATDLEVIDAKGKWTVVRKGDLSKPGFVRDENLQRPNGTKKPEK
jgi:cytoskeletal protein RodZ